MNTPAPDDLPEREAAVVAAMDANIEDYGRAAWAYRNGAFDPPPTEDMQQVCDVLLEIGGVDVHDRPSRLFVYGVLRAVAAAAPIQHPDMDPDDDLEAMMCAVGWATDLVIDTLLSHDAADVDDGADAVPWDLPDPS